MAPTTRATTAGSSRLDNQQPDPSEQLQAAIQGSESESSEQLSDIEEAPRPLERYGTAEVNVPPVPADLPGSASGRTVNPVTADHSAPPMLANPSGSAPGRATMATHPSTPIELELIRQNAELQERLDRLSALLMERPNSPRRRHRRRSPPSSPKLRQVLPTTENHRSSASPYGSYRAGKLSSKIKDPEPLDDGVKPTFEAWRILAEGKLLDNADHYPDEQSKVRAVFNWTTGTAQNHLVPRMTRAEFRTPEAAIDFLATVFLVPNRLELATEDFRALRMGTLTFHQFYTQFLELASEAEIPESTYRREIAYKISSNLRNATLATMDVYPKLRDYTDHLVNVDARLRTANARFKAEGRTRLSNSGSDKNPKPATPSARSNPIVTLRTSIPRPSPGIRTKTPGACYKCGMEGWTKDHVCPSGGIHEVGPNENFLSNEESDETDPQGDPFSPDSYESGKD